MDGNVIATIGSAFAVLGGVYAIVNRTEDRLGKRIEEVKETLRAEIKTASATLELKMVQTETRLNERMDSRIVRG